jgi:hypothetical protein
LAGRRGSAGRRRRPGRAGGRGRVAGGALPPRTLYDLDRIISRTVAYGVLTLLLGLCSAGAVLLLGQLDLDTLTAELLAVVNQTVQPTQASLWQSPSQVTPRMPSTGKA